MQHQFTYSTVLVIAVAALAGCFALPHRTHAAWYSDYQYRRPLTIEAGYNGGVATTTNRAYVIVASTTQEYLKSSNNGGKVQDGNGYDIVFTASDGSTLLNYEKEYYNATTGEAVFWIRTSEGISSTTDSTIYLYYGKSGSTDLSNTTATWGAATGTDPVAVWHMQDSTSTDVVQHDSTTNANHGTFTNTDASGQQQGHIDGSFQFDGKNDYLAITMRSSNIYNTAKGTFEMWLYSDNFSSGAQDDLFVSNSSKIVMGIQSTGNIYFYPNTGDVNNYALLSDPWIDSAWNHLIITWDFGTKEVKFYVNGVKRLAKDMSAIWLTLASGVTSFNFTYTTNPFGGKLDEARIYSSCLTPADIQTMYNMESNNSSFLTFGDEENAAKSVSFTLSAWLKPQSSISTKAIAVKDNELRLVTDSSGHPSCTIHNGAAWQTSAVSTRSLALNEWQYVSCTYDQTYLKTYINGVLTATQSMTENTNDTSNVLNLGYDEGGTYGGFQGFIDEFKFYKYARSSDQIKADYTGVGTERAASTRSVTVGESQDADDGLVAYWKMDEDVWNETSGEVIDYSGNGNNGTAYGGANTTTTAKYGEAGSFDGVNDYVNFGNTSWDKGASYLTVCSWVNTTHSGTEGFVGRSAAKTFTLSKQLTIGNAAFFGVSSDGNGWTAYIRGTTALNDGKWHHICGVYNSTDDLKLYVDGKSEGSITGTEPVSLWSGITSAVMNVGYAYHVNGLNYYQGLIDDVKIYNKARTAEQIRRDYEQGPPPIAHWKMDEKTGQTAYDTSGNYNHGTLGTGATADASDPSWTSGQYGNALKFDGVNDYVSVNGPSISDGSSWSISLWAMTRSMIGIGSALFGTTVGGVSAFLTGDNRVFFSNSGTNYHVWNVADALNTWRYYTFSHIGGTTNVTLYINGVSQGAQSASGSQLLNPRIIGYMAGRGYWNGLIDDVRIYNYALTPKQIIQDMNASHPAVGSPVGSYAAYWPLDEMQGTSAYDNKSISQHTLTLSSSTWASSTDCHLGGCFKGWGASWLSITDALSGGSYDFTATDDFSLSLWAKSSTATNPAADQYLIRKASSSAGYGVYFSATTGYLNFAIDDDSTWTPDASVATSKDYYDNLWHHIVAVKNASSSLEIFVDAVKQNTNSSISTILTLENAAALVIGDSTGSDSGDEFTGTIDDIKIYRFALSPEEIKLEYTKGASMKLGSLSTQADGVTPSDSYDRSFCVPGDTSYCAPPVGWWRMDEKQGQYAYDASGNGNTGTLGANTIKDSTDPYWKSSAFCKSGACLSFDGVNDYVRITDSGASSLDIAGSITVAAWVKPGSSQKSASSAFLGKHGNYKFPFVTNGTTKFTIYTGGTYYSSPTYTYTPNQWVYLVGIYDGSNIKIYADGNYIGQTARTGALDTNDNDLDIGTDSYDVAGRAYTGLVDDVRIYNYVRTPAQIAWDYNQGAPIAWWKMDDGQNAPTTCDGTGSLVHDATGNGYTGTLTLTPAGNTTAADAWSEGKYGCGLSFDGVDDYVTVDNATDFDFISNDFSFGAWIKGAINQSATGRIITKFRSSVSSSYFVSLDDSGHVRWYITDDGTNSLDRTYTGVNYEDNKWHHVFVVFKKGSNGYLYLDGALRDSGSISSVGDLTSYNLMRIGRFRDSDNSFNGSIDDVCVYKYALTSLQIKMLYNEGASVRFGPSEGLP